MREWLETRLEGAPESLRKRVLAAVTELEAEDAPGGGQGAGRPLHVALRDAAARLLDQARTSSGPGGDPLTLLAADALVTYACEAAALADPRLLAELE